MSYLLSFYVPESHVEQVKQALFTAGAGRLGHYQYCAWQTKGRGQFQALEGATPSIGQVNQLETLIEYKVEMLCAKEHIQPVVCALKNTHPYEEVAFSVVECVQPS